MTAGSKLVAVTGEDSVSDIEATPDAPIAEQAEASDDWAAEWDAEEIAASRRWSWLPPTLAVLTIAGWTAFFGWVHQAEILAGASPLQWSQWVTSWAIPVLLVVSLWLLAMRSSKREASKFADAASALSAESALLESRLITVNRELSLAREFLGSQSRELESLGRVASERLSSHASELQDLVQNNGEQVDAIATVSTTALENMGRLRDDLPVIANSARDVSNQIGAAGRTAHGQLHEMVSGFEKLNEFGQASERQVASLRGKVDDALAGFEAQASQMRDITENRFTALRASSDEFRAEMDGREVEMLAAIRQRATSLEEELATARSALDETEEEALTSMRERLGSLREKAYAIGSSVREAEKNAIVIWSEQIEAIKSRLTEAVQTVSKVDATALENSNKKLQELLIEAEAVDSKLGERDALFTQSVQARREQLDQDEREAVGRLEGRLSTLDETISSRRDAQIAHAEELNQHAATIGERLDEFQGKIAALAEQGTDTEMLLAGSVTSLTERLTESREAISGTDSEISALTDASVRLLELVRGAAERAREDLPSAMDETEARIAGVRGEVDTMRIAMDDAVEKGRALSDYVISSKDDGREAADAITALHGRLADAGAGHAEKISQLRKSIEELGAESDGIAEKAQANLQGAIAELEQGVRDAVSGLTVNTSANIREYAEKVGGETAQAVDRALRGRTEQAVAELEEHVSKAANVSREATIQLRDQLAKVNELAGNLESRVERARERAEEQVGNDFSRRVSLITESLNSNAIDISKALSNDVSDTAWASYLRGDRGIFTRRAVSLLDSTEARDIAEVYDTDDDFREYVSRYIHDFEAMLRTMLSTRDGNALGVTLLSSDMGKLYVALAQAIERLRE